MVHNGLRGHVQRYKCKDCGRRFDGGQRRDKKQVITDYIEGKQTKAQLAEKYKVSTKTIERDLKDMRYVQKISKYKQVIIQMDTTYWGRNFGLMVIKDSLRKRILWRKYVTHETIADYMEGVQWLESQGFVIYGIVMDGMRGLMQQLYRYPVQMCQFHQQMIVRRYLAEDPDLEASSALLDLVNSITVMDKKASSERSTNGMKHIRMSLMSVFMISVLRLLHICVPGYAVHTLVLRGTCSGYGRSMSIKIV